MRRSRVLAVVLFTLLAAGCSGDDDPEPDKGSSPTERVTSGSTAAPSSELVAGSGAGLSPDDLEAWCAAITAEQLTEATRVEVVSVGVLGAGCSAEAKDFSVQIIWKGEATSLTSQQYEASWRKPAGVFAVRPVSLDSGAAGASATAESPVQARVGVVHEGVLVEARLSIVVPGEAAPTSTELAEIGERIVAVYAG